MLLNPRLRWTFGVVIVVLVNLVSYQVKCTAEADPAPGRVFVTQGGSTYSFNIPETNGKGTSSGITLAASTPVKSVVPAKDEESSEPETVILDADSEESNEKADKEEDAVADSELSESKSRTQKSKRPILENDDGTEEDDDDPFPSGEKSSRTKSRRKERLPLCRELKWPYVTAGKPTPCISERELELSNENYATENEYGPETPRLLPRPKSPAYGIPPPRPRFLVRPAIGPPGFEERFIETRSEERFGPPPGPEYNPFPPPPRPFYSKPNYGGYGALAQSGPPSGPSSSYSSSYGPPPPTTPAPPTYNQATPAPSVYGPPTAPGYNQNQNQQSGYQQPPNSYGQGPTTPAPKQYPYGPSTTAPQNSYGQSQQSYYGQSQSTPAPQTSYGQSTPAPYSQTQSSYYGPSQPTQAPYQYTYSQSTTQRPQTLYGNPPQNLYSQQTQSTQTPQQVYTQYQTSTPAPQKFYPQYQSSTPAPQNFFTRPQNQTFFSTPIIRTGGRALTSTLSQAQTVEGARNQQLMKELLMYKRLVSILLARLNIKNGIGTSPYQVSSFGQTTTNNFGQPSNLINRPSLNSGTSGQSIYNAIQGSGTPQPMLLPRPISPVANQLRTRSGNIPATTSSWISFFTKGALSQSPAPTPKPQLEIQRQPLTFQQSFSQFNTDNNANDNANNVNDDDNPFPSIPNSFTQSDSFPSPSPPPFYTRGEPYYRANEDFYDNIPLVSTDTSGTPELFETQETSASALAAVNFSNSTNTTSMPLPLSTNDNNAAVANNVTSIVADSNNITVTEAPLPLSPTQAPTAQLSSPQPLQDIVANASLTGNEQPITQEDEVPVAGSNYAQPEPQQPVGTSFGQPGRQTAARSFEGLGPQQTFGYDPAVPQQANGLSNGQPGAVVPPSGSPYVAIVSAYGQPQPNEAPQYGQPQGQTSGGSMYGQPQQPVNLQQGSGANYGQAQQQAQPAAGTSYGPPQQIYNPQQTQPAGVSNYGQPQQQTQPAVGSTYGQPPTNYGPPQSQQAFGPNYEQSQPQSQGTPSYAQPQPVPSAGSNYGPQQASGSYYGQPQPAPQPTAIPNYGPPAQPSLKTSYVPPPSNYGPPQYTEQKHSGVPNYQQPQPAEGSNHLNHESHPPSNEQNAPSHSAPEHHSGWSQPSSDSNQPLTEQNSQSQPPCESENHQGPHPQPSGSNNGPSPPPQNNGPTPPPQINGPTPPPQINGPPPQQSGSNNAPPPNQQPAFGRQGKQYDGPSGPFDQPPPAISQPQGSQDIAEDDPFKYVGTESPVGYYPGQQSPYRSEEQEFEDEDEESDVDAFRYPGQGPPPRFRGSDPFRGSGGFRRPGPPPPKFEGEEDPFVPLHEEDPFKIPGQEYSAQGPPNDISQSEGNNGWTTTPAPSGWTSSTPPPPPHSGGSGWGAPDQQQPSEHDNRPPPHDQEHNLPASGQTQQPSHPSEQGQAQPPSYPNDQGQSQSPPPTQIPILNVTPPGSSDDGNNWTFQPQPLPQGQTPPAFAPPTQAPLTIPTTTPAPITSTAYPSIPIASSNNSSPSNSSGTPITALVIFPISGNDTSNVNSQVASLLNSPEGQKRLSQAIVVPAGQNTDINDPSVIEDFLRTMDVAGAPSATGAAYDPNVAADSDVIPLVEYDTAKDQSQATGAKPA